MTRPGILFDRPLLTLSAQIAFLVACDHASAASLDETPGLPEIVVTAQRREEGADKVPISLTAFNQQAMDEMHLESVNDLATVVPGMVISPPVAQFQDQAEIAIRGIYGRTGLAPTTQSPN